MDNCVHKLYIDLQTHIMSIIIIYIYECDVSITPTNTHTPVCTCSYTCIIFNRVPQFEHVSSIAQRKKKHIGITMEHL